MPKQKQTKLNFYFDKSIPTQSTSNTTEPQTQNVQHVDEEMVDLSNRNEPEIGPSTQPISSQNELMNVCESRLNETSAVIERDPALRKPISFVTNETERDQIIREYLRIGPYQPKLKEYPTDNNKRRFRCAWYSLDSCTNWLEYSPTSDKAYCLYCFLFPGNNASNTFTIQEGFCTWKHMLEKIKGVAKHVGLHNSAHNVARNACQDLLRQSQSIVHQFREQSNAQMAENKKRMLLSIKTAKHLCVQGLPFRGDDESESSLNKGKFLETLEFKVEGTDDEELIKNAPRNAKYTSPTVQKEICLIMSKTVQKMIQDQMKDKMFSIMVDETRDVTGKEWFVLVVRFVNDNGAVIERILDFITVPDTYAETLFESLKEVLNRNNLSMSDIRGQSYDGASNMRGVYSGLQARVLNVNPYAPYVHCCAHRLNLVVVEVCTSIASINTFFHTVQTIHNLISTSPKSKEQLTTVHRSNLAELLEEGLISTGTGLNQEVSVGNLSSTRWSSHYRGLINTKKLYSAICVVLDDIYENTVPITLVKQKQMLQSSKFNLQTSFSI